MTRTHVRLAAAWCGLVLILVAGLSAADPAPDIQEQIRLFRTGTWAQHMDAVVALMKSGVAGKAAMPALLDDLRERNPDPYINTRYLTIKALINIGVAAPETVLEVAQALEHPDREVRAGAFEVLAGLGPGARAAGPMFIEVLKRGDAPSRGRAATALGQIGRGAPEAIAPLMGALGDPAPGVQLSAITALGAAGPSARAAIPALIARLGVSDPDQRRLAAEALGEIDAAATPDAPPLGNSERSASDPVPALIRTLHDAEPRVAQSTAKALVKIGGVAEPDLFAGLIPGLFDPNDTVRESVATELGALARPGVATPEMVSNLARALHYRPAPVIAGAIRSLGTVATATTARRQPLSHSEGWRLAVALHEAQRRLRDYAATNGGADSDDASARDHAMVRIRAALSALPPLPPSETLEPAPEIQEEIYQLESGARDQQLRATLALMRSGAAGKPAAPALIETLRRRKPGGSSNTRSLTISALTAIALAAPDVAPTLAQALGDPDQEVQTGVMEVLGRIGPAAHAAVPVLIGALGTGPEVRIGVLGLLGKIGPEARAAIPILIDTLKTGDGPSRRGAGDALGRIGHGAPEVVAPLIGAVNDPDPPVQASAIAALGVVGPVARLAIPALIRELDGGTSNRRLAAEALGEIGAASPHTGSAPGSTGAAAEAVPGLIRALRDGDAPLRQAAAFALGKIGSTAPSVCSKLLETLGDKHEEVRSAAATALGALASPATATPEILLALNRTVYPRRGHVSEAAAGSMGAVAAVLASGPRPLSDAEANHLAKALHAVYQRLQHDLAESYGVAGRFRAGFRESAGKSVPRLRAVLASLPALPVWKEGITYSRRGVPVAPGATTWELFVSSYDTDEVLCYDGATRHFLGALAAPELRKPQGVTFGPDGNVYVTSATNQVLRFHGVTGACLGVFASGGGLSHPVGVSFGPDGNLYVASHDTHQVLRYAGATGAFMDVFVKARSGGLIRPHGLAFGPDGDLYVTSATHQVLRYAGRSGEFRDVFAAHPALQGPTDLRFGPDGALYTVYVESGCVGRFDGRTGAFRDRLDLVGPLSSPIGLLFGPDGALYVSGWESSSVARIPTKPGESAEEWLLPGSDGLARAQVLAGRVLPQVPERFSRTTATPNTRKKP